MSNSHSEEQRLKANWNEIPSEVVRPGVTRRAFGTEECLLVMAYCEPGMELKPHSHDFDQLALFTKGRAIYTVGDVRHEVGPETVLLIPAGETHYIEPVGDEVVHNLDVFAPARSDYLHLIEWMKGEASA
jgi:quercetin dioxygenase-like cupin family protein